MTVLIILLAVVLRLVLLNQSLWLDESLEALALSGRMGPILRYALYDFQPPLYHLLGIAWTKLAGYSELALRFPSLISGVGTVWFTLKLGELSGSKKVGRLAGLLASTNPLLIYYSQEGRTYAMTAFFMTASFYYLIRLLREKTSRGLVLCYLLFTIAALWTSYIAWLVIGLQGLYLLYRRRFQLFGLTAVSSLTLLAWLPYLLSSLSIGLSTAGSSPEWGKIVGGISLKALALTWIKINIGRIGFDNNYLYGAIVLFLFLLHAYVLRRLKKTDPLLYIWLLGPVILTALLSLLVPVYSYFRLLFIIPAYLVLLALALSRRRPHFTYLFIGLNLLFLTLYWLSPQFHREDWRGLTQYLNTAPSGAVGMPSLNQSAPLTYYGLNKPLFEPKVAHPENLPTVYYIRYVEDLFDVAQKGPENLRRAGYTINESRTYSGLQIDVYTK